MKDKFISTKVSKNENGFSLIELLIVLVIFLIVTAAIYGILQIAMHSRIVNSQQLGITKNARVSLNLLGRDTYNAGYGYPTISTVVIPNLSLSSLVGIPPDSDNTRDTIPSIIVGNNITPNNFNNTPGVKTDQVTFLFKDTTFNVVNNISQSLSIKVPKTVNGVVEIEPTSGSNSVCRANDLYIITGNTGSTLGLVTKLSGSNVIQFSNGDVLGFNKNGDTLRNITLPASLERVLMVTYFVNAEGMLVRREYGNAAPVGTETPAKWRDEPLVYGVEDFQIKYVLDDGTLTDNPSAGPDGIAGTSDDVQENLKKIRQVMFTVGVKTVETDENGNNLRKTMTSTFSTRNLGYDAR